MSDEELKVMVKENNLMLREILALLKGLDSPQANAKNFMITLLQISYQKNKYITKEKPQQNNMC